MTAAYSAADALLYVRELFDSQLSLVHDQLLERYGQIEDDGETYLPPALASAIAGFYLLGHEITDETVALGLNAWSRDGRLLIAARYSTGQPLYEDEVIIVDGELCTRPYLVPPARPGESGPESPACDSRPTRHRINLYREIHRGDGHV